jgi:hypothetical protein
LENFGQKRNIRKVGAKVGMVSERINVIKKKPTTFHQENGNDATHSRLRA